MNWQSVASGVIGEVHKSLPVDADLKTRKRALNEARPYEFSATSWGRKVWAKHARNYLEKFGLEPLSVKRGNRLPLSPMERMMQRAKSVSLSSAAPHLPADEKAVPPFNKRGTASLSSKDGGDEE
ncbi:hypothetical protein ABE527_05075 [Brucella sp. TWI432]